MKTIQSVKDNYAFVVGYDTWERLVLAMIVNFPPEKACEAILEHEKDAEKMIQKVCLKQTYDNITERTDLLSVEQKELYKLITNKTNILK